MTSPIPNRNRGPTLGWHRWFAWHPVEDRSKTYWLMFVERMWDIGEHTGETGWRYRTCPRQTH